MNSLVLTLKTTPAQNVDMSPLVPDRLQGKSIDRIGKIKLVSGNKTIAVSTLFDIEGEDTNNIEIKKSTPRLELIGAGMTGGRIKVSGSAGDYVGLGMLGGEIHIRGNSADWLGSGMKKGLISVSGNVGDCLGCARPGDAQGMKGGVIHIKGNAGNRIGDRMRRGLLVIEGNAGDFCGARMLAGSIVVLGNVGEQAGYAMKRGTLLLTATPASIPASFNSCGMYSPNFLALLFKDLAGISKTFKSYQNFKPRVERYAGDLSWDGKGELLIMQTTP